MSRPDFTLLHLGEERSYSPFGLTVTPMFGARCTCGWDSGRLPWLQLKAAAGEHTCGADEGLPLEAYRRMSVDLRGTARVGAA